MRFTGWPLASSRSGSSPGSDTIRCAVTRCRVMAASLFPCLGPNAEPVSSGLANGSKLSFVQSESMAANMSLMTEVSMFSTWSSSALRYASLYRPANRSTVP